MTYRYLTGLDGALQAAAIPYTEVPQSPLDPTFAPTWRERGRPAYIGPFDPVGVCCHHTASPVGTSAQADINVILAGSTQAPGPISQLYLDRDSQLFLVAAGRANHAGSGIRPGVDDDCSDMNACLVGIEVANNGVGERWPDAQTEMYARVVAALCDWYGWDDVYFHATTGPPSGGCNSKIDPAGPWQLEPHLVGSTTWNLDIWLDYVAAFRGGPPPPHEEDDDVTPCPLLIQASGTDGTLEGAVYVTDGRFTTVRWVADTYQLGDIQYWLRAAGLDDQITPVDRVASYGVLVGPTPS